MTHGGKREGAGRKPAKEKRKVHGVRCTDPGWLWLNGQATKKGHNSVGKWADNFGKPKKDLKG